MAEGVEDAETLELLLAMGCDQVQGFHIAVPMDAGSLAKLFEQGQLRAADPVGSTVR